MEEKITSKASEMYSKNMPNLRWGQCIFNAAYELYPERADKLRGTYLDCFYDNKKVEVFMDCITSFSC